MLDDAMELKEQENTGIEVLFSCSSWRQALDVDLQRPKIPPTTINIFCQSPLSQSLLHSSQMGHHRQPSTWLLLIPLLVSGGVPPTKRNIWLA